MNTLIIVLCVILAAGMTWFVCSCKKAPVIDYPEQLPEMSLVIKDMDFSEIKNFHLVLSECENESGKFEFDYRIWAFMGDFRYEINTDGYWIYDLNITDITSVENQDYELGNDILTELKSFLNDKIKDRL